MTRCAPRLALNLPIRVVPAGDDPCPAALIRVDGRTVTVEAIKLADDQSGDVVVRLYESLGGRAQAQLTAGFPVSAVEAVDLLERPLESVVSFVLDGDSVQVSLRPFQVLTLRWRRG